jgi:hypothetical protein
MSPPLSSPPGSGYFKTRELDWMLHVVQAVAEETAVTRERLMTLEALLVEKGLLAKGEIDGYRVDGAEAQARIAWHEAFTARLYAVLEETAKRK